ncbi:glycoside hydrolase family 88/105 protein [Hymenobacter sp. B1770]|uniref:glycoside hydrolase family 88/105 protein n=1 Tax=Hymenobacter sp. B1770 TaxID=1718788 RepID=UPI003CF4E25C
MLKRAQAGGLLLALGAAVLLAGPLPASAQTSPATALALPATVPATAKWSERMALSVLKRSPWMADPALADNWGYTQGLIMHALEELSRQTREPRYQAYLQLYGNKMVNAQGEIYKYKPEDLSLDNINSGKILFKLYADTKQEKYKLALQKLHEQLQKQPKTSDGGYWHKLKYPSQMWLDGAYMASPFVAQYAAVFNEPAGFDEATKQLLLLEKHLRDPKTGLLYHGWDEKHVQAWANPQTGQSPHFWGRAIGWYGMALVDVLDYLPAKHPDRPKLLKVLDRLAVAIQQYQDPATGLWYQVMDKAGQPGNYLEASASCMFVYTLAKGVNKGYLSKKYRPVAEKGYAGITTKFIEVKPNGELNLLQVCEVAGLGPGTERNGSYEYYVKEPIKINDPKGTGPFILASLELKK